MSIKTALRQSPVVTFAVVVAGLWLLRSWLRVFGRIDLATPSAVGQGALTGIVGLVVLAITLGLLFALVGELGDATPGPNTWPPTE